MELLKFDEDMMEDVAGLYAEAVKKVPYCYPVALEDFAAAVAGAVGGDPKGKGLQEEGILVGANKGKPKGYAHFGVGKHRKEQTEPSGYVRFFWYCPTHRAVGEALLQEMESFFREKGLGESVAFWQCHRYPFYHRENSFLSEQMAHVPAFLGRNGYEIQGGEVFYDWPEMRVPQPERPNLDFEETVIWQEGAGELPNSEVRAVQEGKVVGVCETASCQESGDGPGVGDWCFVLHLNVTEKLQGRGLGRYLLSRSLQEMKGAGYKHAGISTSMKNYRAAIFYSSFGEARLGDWTYGWVKQLD